MARAARKKTQKRRTSRKQAKGGMWSWYLAGLLTVATVVAYEHRAQIVPMADAFYTASVKRQEPAPKRHDNRSTEKRTTSPLAEPRVAKSVLARVPLPPEGLTQQAALPSAMPAPGMRPVEVAAYNPGGGKAGKFYFCTESLENCVVDGGTFWYGRRKIEIADIRAPKIKQARCESERKLGSLAKKRLWEILNSGDVELAAASSGQGARVTVGQGRSIGDMLVAEGLARRQADAKHGWCGKG